MTDNQGGFTVEIDGDDIQHLTMHGSSVVCKEVGPIEVKIRCRSKIYPKFIMQEDGETSEVFTE